MGDDLDVDALLEEPYMKKNESEDRKDHGERDKHSSRSPDNRKSRDRRDRDRDRPSRDRGDRRRSRSRDRGDRRGDRRRSRSRDRRRSRSRDRGDRRGGDRRRSRSRDRRRSPQVRGGVSVRGRRDRTRSRTPETPLSPEERDGRTVFIMQLSQRVRARDVEEFFSSVGKIRDVKLIICNKTRRFKGICYVEFRDMESVPLALGLSGQKLLGVPVIVQPSQAEKNRVGNYNEPIRTKDKGPMRLYIGSLHFNITEEMLRGIFEPFGTIQSIQLMMDTETGRSKGYGFITYTEAEDAKKALEQLNGFELAGRPMKVGNVTERDAPIGPTGGLDNEELDRSGFDLGATGRLALMAKLAEGTGMNVPNQSVPPPPMPMGGPPPMPAGGGAPPPQVSLPPMAVQQQQHLANTNPPIATQCFMLSNMFDPSQETQPGWDMEVRDDVIDECNKYGGVLHLLVDPQSPSGNVYVKCPNIATAVAAVNALHGRWFAGKVITAAYVPLINYHNLFPDAISSMQLLTTNR